MGEYGELIIVAVLIAIGFIGNNIMCSKINRETGADLRGGTGKKLLMAVSCIGAMIVVATTYLKITGSAGAFGSEENMTVFAGVVALVGGYLALFFMNKKATGTGQALLLSLFQVLYGLLTIVVLIFKIIGHFCGIEFGQGTQKKQAQYTKQQVDDKIAREDHIAPEFATPEQKDEKARAEGYGSYEELDKKANMTAED